MLPASRSGSQRSFCSGVAYSTKVRIGPKLPAWTTSALRGQTEAICSMAITAVEQRAALPAVFGIEGNAHQALLAHHLRDIARKMRIMRALERAGLQVRLGETAHLIRECLLLFSSVQNSYVWRTCSITLPVSQRRL